MPTPSNITYLLPFHWQIIEQCHTFISWKRNIWQNFNICNFLFLTHSFCIFESAAFDSNFLRHVFGCSIENSGRKWKHYTFFQIFGLGVKFSSLSGKRGSVCIIIIFINICYNFINNEFLKYWVYEWTKENKFLN